MTPLSRQVADLFHPLTDLYTTSDVMRLHIRPIDAVTVPAPYCDLLIHAQDMTSTLEAYWNTTFRLQVLDKHVEDSQLTRQVVLLSNADDRPVEFGAIRINLDLFEAPPRAEILECRRPLGAILTRHGVAFECRPNAFFSFVGDEIARRAFDLHEAHTLYGRHNLLQDDEGAVLAEVVEILPPMPLLAEST